MHKVLHNFSDWELETCHMTRTERSIYFDMRTLYLKLGKPLTDDMELLSKRLRCVNDEEINALNFLLKDKFKHDKKTKTYHQSEWDLILKNYKFRHRNGNAETHDETQCETHDETASKNSERLRAYRERVKKIVSSLTAIGVKANSRMTSKELNLLCKQHNVTLNDETLNNDEMPCETVRNAETLCETVENRAITINQEPLTNNQSNNSLSNAHEQKTADEVLAKAEQVKQANAQDIQNWIVPSLDDMRSILFQAGFQCQLNQKDYDRHASDFKVYFAEQAILGKPIATDSLRKNKLRDWIVRDGQKKPSYQKKSSQANEQRFGTKDDPLAVDVVWNQPVAPVSQMTYEEWEAEEKAKQAARESVKTKGFEVIE